VFRFNIDNKYGRAALEATFKAIMGYEQPIVKPPSDYRGDFFKGAHIFSINPIPGFFYSHHSIYI
jgi:hypothetical protein